MSKAIAEITTSRPSLFHVTNGESAGNTLRQTALGGAVLPWQDVLHEGPVPALPRNELLHTRARFLADCGLGTRQALLSSLEQRDRQLLEALRDDLQVVLWFEHDLYDQLQLLDVLALAYAEQTQPELIVVGSFPGRPSFAGLGELTASELETLWPSRGRATAGRARGRHKRLGRLSGAGADHAGRVGDARHHAPAVPRARAATAARGTTRAGRRALGDGATGAPRRRSRRAHASRRVRRSTTTRGGPVPRRRLVLPRPLGTRAGRDEAPRDRRPHTASPSSPAERQPAVRTPPAAADLERRARAPRRSRPSRTPWHRPLDRRHPRDARQHLALGRRRPEARSTVSRLGPEPNGGMRAAPAGSTLRETGSARRGLDGNRARACHPRVLARLGHGRRCYKGEGPVATAQ